MAVKDGIISAVGTRDMAPPRAGRVIKGGNRVVLPGFVDSHSHISAAALGNICKNGSGFRNRHDALEAVSRAAALDAASEWVVFFYVDWDAWDDPRPPTAADLEQASAGRRVLLVCTSLHRGILSESGLKGCHYSASHSRFIETSRGKPNGIVWEEAFSTSLQTVMLSVITSLGADGLKEVVLAEANRHLAYGITSAHDPAVNLTMSRVMHKVKNVSPLHISWSQPGNNGPVSSAETDGNPLEYFGDGQSSAKVFVDGAHRCAMCIDAGTALTMAFKTLADSVKTFNPYPVSRLLADKVGFKNLKLYRKGNLFTKEELQHQLLALSKSYKKLKVHALGNFALELTCACIVESGLTTRACIEHATIIDDQNLETLSKHKFRVSLQPGFLPHYAPLFIDMHPGNRLRGLAARSLLDTGVELMMSSDNPCGPLDPLHNMRCAVERTLPDGRLYLEDEAVSQSEAVYAYTIAAGLGINGQFKPGLVAGAPADFVVLTGDPFKEGTVVDSTYIDGRPVYQREM